MESFKYGNGVWATKEGSSLAYNDENDNYKPLPFSVTRDSIATRVNKQGLIEVVGKDKLRIDYTDSTKGVALLEPARTNLITYSEDFSEWGALGGAVVTDNFITSPDGTQNAAKVVYNGTSLSRIEISTGASGTNTQSIYLKTASGTQTVSIGAASNSLTEITVTEEWQRFTHTGSGSFPRVLCNDAATIYVWGAQLEQGSYATSYIPTSGSTVPRAADVANGAGNSEVFNDSEGVLFADISALVNSDTTNPNRGFGISSTSNNNLIFIYYQSSLNRLSLVIVSDGTTRYSHSETSFSVDNYLRIGLKYKQNDFAFWINGFEVDASEGINGGNTPIGLNKLSFDNGIGLDDFYGKAKRIGYFDAVLTDAELEALTSYTSFTNMANELNLTIK